MWFFGQSTATAQLDAVTMVDVHRAAPPGRPMLIVPLTVRRAGNHSPWTNVFTMTPRRRRRIIKFPQLQPSQRASPGPKLIREGAEKFGSRMHRRVHCMRRMI